MARILRQSTAFTFRIGPFLDDTDFKTTETGLSIAQGDIQISKDGGAFAQTSATTPTTTHDTDAWYQCPLTATDTGTLRPLTVQIAMTGALPVWEHFIVVPANIYDALVDGTDYLQVDAMQVEGSDATDQINAAADTAISDASLATSTALATAQADLDLLTGTDGATLATSQPNYAPATPAQVNAEVIDVLYTDTNTELAAVPASTTNLASMIKWLFILCRNKFTQTATTATIRNDGDTADVGAATVSESAGTFTRGEFS